MRLECGFDGRQMLVYRRLDFFSMNLMSTESAEYLGYLAVMNI